MPNPLPLPISSISPSPFATLRVQTAQFLPPSSRRDRLQQQHRATWSVSASAAPSVSSMKGALPRPARGPFGECAASELAASFPISREHAVAASDKSLLSVYAEAV